jgi:hypothetical protein
MYCPISWLSVVLIINTAAASSEFEASDALRMWLVEHRLIGRAAELTSLGVECLLDLPDVEDQDLKEMSFSKLEQRRWQKGIKKLNKPSEQPSPTPPVLPRTLLPTSANTRLPMPPLIVSTPTQKDAQKISRAAAKVTNQPSPAEAPKVTASGDPKLIWRDYDNMTVEISETGAVATFKGGSPRHGSLDGRGLLTSELPLTEGRHFWEVELVSEALGQLYVGVTNGDQAA